MARSRPIPDDLPLFAGLAVQRITVGRAAEALAVHVRGRLAPGRLPLVCLAGYNRNMADFAPMLEVAAPLLGDAHPVILIDLKGRGRSSDRAAEAEYSTLRDASDVSAVLRALAVDRAVLLGQGHGGQVAMALAVERPALIAATILIDAGPVSEPRGLVRLKTTLNELQGVRGEASLRPMMRRMLALDYPAAPATTIESLILRTHFLDARERLEPLFDDRLITLLDGFDLDDVLLPQWPFFDALAVAPLMMMRSQLTQQLKQEVFDLMMARRRDADAYVIEQQGSPALLDNAGDVQPITDFVKQVAMSQTLAA